MNYRQTALLFFLLFVPVLVQSQSGPFYVDDNIGNDSNPGTFASPFLTIEKAANAMSTNVSVASCYIYPGVYSEQVTILSNLNTGFMVFTALTQGRLPVLDGKGKTNYGFFINNADRVIIRDLVMTKYSQYGVRMEGDATNNFFIKNNIYSNENSGISLLGDNVDRNHILSNQLWDNNNLGISLSVCDYNYIISNHIYRNNGDGMYLINSCRSNYIMMNLIYSNQDNGIEWHPGGGGLGYNFFINNDIFGGLQDDGLACSFGASSHYIMSNRIHHHTSSGMAFAYAWNFYIAHNQIYSNNTYGVAVFNWAQYNVICSNHIWGPHSWGIVTGCNKGTRIYRNLVHDGLYSQILVYYDGTSNIIVANNTVKGSQFEDGILWTNMVTGTMCNNVSISNNYWGIRVETTGIVVVSNNVAFGNNLGDILCTNNAGQNFTDNPFLATATSFTITTPSSICVDHGKFIPGITDIFYGGAPDIGYKESIWTYIPPPEHEVSNVTDIEKIVLAPNPFRPKNGVATFFNVPDDTKITIYDINGFKQKELALPDAEHKILWDGTDDRGKELRRGAYFIRLQNSRGASRTIKFVIIR